AKQLDDIPTDSAEAERQHIRPEQHHCAHLGFGKRFANSAGVTTDKVQLKLPQVVLRHTNIGEFAEAGVDSVNHGIASYNLFDYLARSSDARTRWWRDCNVLVTNCDCSDLLKSERLTVQLHLRSLVEKNSLGRDLLIHPCSLLIYHSQMRRVVFLRGVNVGKGNRCQPAVIARQLSKLGVINIGAVGTFVVSKNVSESALRAAIAKKLPFKCEIMICPPRDIIQLASKDPFEDQRSNPNIIRFVNILAKRLPSRPPLPLCLPSDDDWLLKIIAIENRFVLGLYRREMKAISYLGKIEKQLGVPPTTRNWNTIKKVVQILSQG